MTNTADMSRRTALLIGTAGTAVALVGCSTAKPAASGSTDAKKGNSELAKVSDIPVGGSIEATLDGKPILISQPTAGKVVAFSAVCTHQGCIVKPADSEFDCPCHGSKYDAATGKVIGGPAPKPLPEVAVTVSGNSVTAA